MWTGYSLWLKGQDVLRRNVWPHVKQSPTNPSAASWITRMKFTTPLPTFQFSNQSSCCKMRWLHLSVVILWACSLYSASADNSGVKKMKVQFATGPLLKFQIWWVRVWSFLCRSIPGTGRPVYDIECVDSSTARLDVITPAEILTTLTGKCTETEALICLMAQGVSQITSEGCYNRPVIRC